MATTHSLQEAVFADITFCDECKQPVESGATCTACGTNFHGSCINEGNVCHPRARVGSSSTSNKVDGSLPGTAYLRQVSPSHERISAWLEKTPSPTSTVSSPLRTGNGPTATELTGLDVNYVPRRRRLSRRLSATSASCDSIPENAETNRSQLPSRRSKKTLDALNNATSNHTSIGDSKRIPRPPPTSGPRSLSLSTRQSENVRGYNAGINELHTANMQTTGSNASVSLANSVTSRHKSSLDKPEEKIMSHLRKISLQDLPPWPSSASLDHPSELKGISPSAENTAPGTLNAAATNSEGKSMYQLSPRARASIYSLDGSSISGMPIPVDVAPSQSDPRQVKIFHAFTARSDALLDMLDWITGVLSFRKDHRIESIFWMGGWLGCCINPQVVVLIPVAIVLRASIAALHPLPYPHPSYLYPNPQVASTYAASLGRNLSWMERWKAIYDFWGWTGGLSRPDDEKSERTSLVKEKSKARSRPLLRLGLIIPVLSGCASAATAVGYYYHYIPNQVVTFGLGGLLFGGSIALRLAISNHAESELREDTVDTTVATPPISTIPQSRKSIVVTLSIYENERFWAHPNGSSSQISNTYTKDLLRSDPPAWSDALALAELPPPTESFPPPPNYAFVDESWWIDYTTVWVDESRDLLSYAATPRKTKTKHRESKRASSRESSLSCLNDRERTRTSTVLNEDAILNLDEPVKRQMPRSGSIASGISDDGVKSIGSRRSMRTNATAAGVDISIRLAQHAWTHQTNADGLVVLPVGTPDQEGWIYSDHTWNPIPQDPPIEGEKVRKLTRRRKWSRRALLIQ